MVRQEALLDARWGAIVPPSQLGLFQFGQNGLTQSPTHDLTKYVPIDCLVQWLTDQPGVGLEQISSQRREVIEAPPSNPVIHALDQSFPHHFFQLGVNILGSDGRIVTLANHAELVAG